MKRSSKKLRRKCGTGKAATNQSTKKENKEFRKEFEARPPIAQVSNNT
jgi:hypothetical protein